MIQTPHKVAPGEPVDAAHYNALLDYVLRTTPRMGRNVLFDEKPNGIFISAAGGAAAAKSSETPPFAVRWHGGTSGDGQWEIYLPDGCVTGAYSYLFVALTPAKVSPGHSGDEDEWYRLAVDDVETPQSIVVHVKWPCTRQGYNVPVAYVYARAQSSAQSYETQRQLMAGDLTSATVATVEIGPEIRRIRQTRTVPLDVAAPDAAPFDLQYTFSFSPDGEAELSRIQAVRQYVVAGFVSHVGSQNANIPLGATYVYLKFDTTVSPPAASIVADPEDTTTTDEVTWVRLYRLSHGFIMEDDRPSLYGVVFYR